MSEERKYGYGSDIRMKFNEEGFIDLVINQTGDIDLVGSNNEDVLLVRVESAIQQIKMRLATPLNSLQDENGNTLSIGSLLLPSIGEGLRDTVIMYLKASVIAAVSDLTFIDSINRIDFITDRVNSPTTLQIGIGFTLKDDNEIYYSTIDLVGS